MKDQAVFMDSLLQKEKEIDIKKWLIRISRS